MTEEKQSRIDFREYGKILFKRRWTIATFFVIVVTLVTIATLVQTPVYQATAIIQIEPKPPEVISFKEVVSLGSQNYWANKEYYQTQFWIVQSVHLAQKVVDALDLTSTDPVFEGNPKAAEMLSKMVSVMPMKNSQLVKISITHPNSNQAAAICNELARQYQTQNLTFKIEQSREALRWLENKGEDNEAVFRQAQKALLDFMKKNDIVSFEEKQNIILQRLQDLSQAETRARKQRIETQAAYEKSEYLRKIGKALQIPETTDNNLIQQLKEERVQLEKKYAELSPKYKSKHPDMVKLQSQIDLLNAKIDDEVSNIVGALKTAYLVDREREKTIKKEVEKAKAEAQDLNEKGIEYSVLKRKVDSESAVFSELVRRAKETQITEKVGPESNNIIIREEAMPPKGHIKPKRKTNVLLGAILGLFGGLGLAFLLEYMDTTIKNQQDLERATGLPFLGIIPSFSGAEDELPSELFTHDYPKSSVTESVRSIRTNIVFSSPENPLRKMLVTSAGPQEGKSTTVINLGIIFAQGGNRVLLVDSDLRRPRLHKAFGVQRDLGLTNLVMHESTAEEVIVETDVPNLFLIPCGPIPPNPSEMLGSSRMDEIIVDLQNRFDIVLFDSPPIVAVTDAVVLSKKVDGVVLIAKAGKTTSEMMSRAKRQLQDVNTHILGTVLNDFNLRGEGYRYYYYYHYYRSEDGEKTRRRVRKKKAATPQSVLAKTISGITQKKNGSGSDSEKSE